MFDEPVVLNMDDREARVALMSHVGTRRGLHEVLIKPRKQTRSLNANRYYWVAVVLPWRDWLREAYGDPTIDKNQAHEALKAAVLGMPAVSNGQGKAVGLPPRTRRMKTDEFAHYTEAAAQFLGEFCQIEVLDSKAFFQR